MTIDITVDSGATEVVAPPSFAADCVTRPSKGSKASTRYRQPGREEGQDGHRGRRHAHDTFVTFTVPRRCHSCMMKCRSSTCFSLPGPSRLMMPTQANAPSQRSRLISKPSSPRKCFSHIASVQPRTAEYSSAWAELCAMVPRVREQAYTVAGPKARAPPLRLRLVDRSSAQLAPQTTIWSGHGRCTAGSTNLYSTVPVQYVPHCPLQLAPRESRWRGTLVDNAPTA